MKKNINDSFEGDTVCLGGTLMNTIELQISVFGKYKDIIPTPERFSALMTSLPGFLPVASQAINIDAITGKIENLARIQMNDQNTAWRIEVQPERINVIYSPNNIDTEINTHVDYGIALFQKTCESLKLNTENGFMRLAVNAQFADPTGSKKPIMPFVTQFPKQITNQEELSEWTISFNKQGMFELNKEKIDTNEIMACSLGTSRVDTNQYALLMTADINTTQNDLRERFGMNDLVRFVSYAKEKMGIMLENFPT